MFWLLSLLKRLLLSDMTPLLEWWRKSLLKTCCSLHYSDLKPEKKKILECIAVNERMMIVSPEPCTECWVWGSPFEPCHTRYCDFLSTELRSHPLHSNLSHQQPVFWWMNDSSIDGMYDKHYQNTCMQAPGLLNNHFSLTMNCTRKIVMGVSLLAVHSICSNQGVAVRGLGLIRASSAYAENSLTLKWIELAWYMW